MVEEYLVDHGLGTVRHGHGRGHSSGQPFPFATESADTTEPATAAFCNSTGEGVIYKRTLDARDVHVLYTVSVCVPYCTSTAALRKTQIRSLQTAELRSICHPTIKRDLAATRGLQARCHFQANFALFSPISLSTRWTALRLTAPNRHLGLGLGSGL